MTCVLVLWYFIVYCILYHYHDDFNVCIYVLKYDCIYNIHHDGNCIYCMCCRTADSSDDTIVTSTAQVTSVAEEYSTENFESELTSSHTPSTNVPASPKKNYGSSAHSPQKLASKSPKRSESESEDSVSVAHSGKYDLRTNISELMYITMICLLRFSNNTLESGNYLTILCIILVLIQNNLVYLETASDLSDVEGRVRALNDKLHRRKIEVERLKRAKKKKKHDKWKEEELSLQKQIEVGFF